MFRTYILDHDEFNAYVMLDMIKRIVSGILGKELSNEDTSSESVDVDSESSEAKN